MTFFFLFITHRDVRDEQHGKGGSPRVAIRKENPNSDEKKNVVPLREHGLNWILRLVDTLNGLTTQKICQTQTVYHPRQYQQLSLIKSKTIVWIFLLTRKVLRVGFLIIFQYVLCRIDLIASFPSKTILGHIKLIC